MKLSPFPPGWCLGYLIRKDEDGYEVGFLPIVGMEATLEGIHAVVAYPTGALVRDCDIEHPIICIVGPDDDRDRVGRAGVAEYLRAAHSSAAGAAALG